MALSDLTESRGFEEMHGLRLLWELQRRADTVTLRGGDCALEGFEDPVNTSYRAPHVILKGSEGTITATVPSAGEYYLAVPLYDTGGTPRLRAALDGKELGVIVARHGNKRTWLFTHPTRLSLRGGEKITLEALSPATYMVEDLLLLTERPPVAPWEYDIQAGEGAAEFLPGKEDAPRGRITWVTTWPARCRVEYGETEAYGSAVEEPAAAANHRVYLPDLKLDTLYHYRITAATPGGQTVRTPDATFRTAPPAWPKGSVARATAPLSVDNPHDFPLSGWPVTTGLPFPRGCSGNGSNVRLLDASGDAVPCQVRVTCRWPDGSVRWVLLDFQADLEPGAGAAYTMEYGSEVRRKPAPEGIDITRGNGTITVNTGAVQVRFDPHGSGLMTEIALCDEGGKLTPITRADAPLVVELVGEDGKTHTTLSAPDEVLVEEAGPLRATVLLKGQHKNDHGEALFAYEIRAHFYAGKPYFRLFYTWGNDWSESTFYNLDSIVLHIPIAPDAREYVITGDEPRSARLGDGESLGLGQYFSTSFEWQENGRAAGEGRRALGCVDLSDGTLGLAVATRDFWQHYPKSVEVAPGEIRIGICPPLRENLYADCSDLDEIKLYYYLKGSKYKLKEGVSKRHELLLHPHRGDAAQDSVRLAAVLNDPPLAFATPDWYCDSEAFGEVLSTTSGSFPTYDRSVLEATRGYLAQREERQEYGMLNFGDWWGERRVNWGNIEYDTQHAFLLHWIRSGERELFFPGEQACRHNMDVDMVRYSSDPSRVGAVYVHCMGHTGDYFTRPYEGSGIPRGGISVSHTWTEGYLDYYFLTGDRRALEAAMLVADHYNGAYMNDYDFQGGIRSAGWHVMLLAAVYGATLDPYYRNAMQIIMERVFERQDPDTGGWERQMVPGHCHCLPRHRGNAGFMLGVLFSSMRRYHWITGDERVPDSLVRGCRYVIDTMWEEEEKRFRYTSCPNSPPRIEFRLLEAMVYAALVSGDPEILRIATTTFSAGAGEISSGGKGISGSIRFTPHTLYLLEKLGKTEKDLPR